ncbi:MAG: hypothetical protein FWB98_02365 [Defluviitaleaceae bacterium]|nr:hypothetical protein [Defluviitaleaceae bacterium]
MGINSLHADHITREWLGFRKSLRMILGIVLVLVLMLVNGYVQAHRLVGQWQSHTGNVIIEFNRDGTGRHWTYWDGWSEYGEWHANAFHNTLYMEAFSPGVAPFRIRGNNLEKFYLSDFTNSSSGIYHWTNFTRIEN